MKYLRVKEEVDRFYRFAPQFGASQSECGNKVSILFFGLEWNNMNIL